MRVTYPLAIAAFAAGCALNPAPVPVTADPAGEALVLGNWSGSYYSNDGGRTGSIIFQFHRHEGAALECAGDVVMAVPARQAMPANEDRGTVSEDVIRVLTIEMVNVKGDAVSGRMASYTDPDTGESLSTTFEGRVKGDMISGTLLTFHARSGVRESGTWEVTREKNEKK